MYVCISYSLTLIHSCRKIQLDSNFSSLPNHHYKMFVGVCSIRFIRNFVRSLVHLFVFVAVVYFVVILFNNNCAFKYNNINKLTTDHFEFLIILGSLFFRLFLFSTNCTIIRLWRLRTRECGGTGELEVLRTLLCFPCYYCRVFFYSQFYCFWLFLQLGFFVVLVKYTNNAKITR